MVIEKKLWLIFFFFKWPRFSIYFHEDTKHNEARFRVRLTVLCSRTTSMDITTLHDFRREGCGTTWQVLILRLDYSWTFSLQDPNQTTFMWVLALLWQLALNWAMYFSCRLNPENRPLYDYTFWTLDHLIKNPFLQKLVGFTVLCRTWLK